MKQAILFFLLLLNLSAMCQTNGYVLQNADGSNNLQSNSINPSQINVSANVKTLLGASTYSAFRTSLGTSIGVDVQAYSSILATYSGLTPTTVGQNYITLANPGAISFIRINADNSIIARSAANFLIDIGAQASGSYVLQSTTVNGHALSSNVSVTASDVSLGNVTNESKAVMFTSPAFTGTISGITATMVGLGSVTNNAQLTIANNLSDLNSASTSRGNLGGTTVGQSLFTLTNPGAITFLRVNADNSISSRTAAQFLSDIGGQTSGSFATTATTDSMRTNIYNSLNGKQASGSYVLQSTTVNGHALSGNISVTATDLNLVIGTNTQGYSANLTTWSGIAPTTIGQNIVALANPGAVTFPRYNADNTVTARTAAQLLSDIGAQASGSYATTATTDSMRTNIYAGLNGKQASGSYVLQSTTVNGHALSGNVSVTTGDLGATTVGASIFGLTNPGAITFLRINADNSVTARSAANFLSDIGAQASGSYVLQSTTVAGFSLSGNITLAALTATDASITFSGSYNGATARTVGLNLGNANSWSAVQTFTAATPQLILGVNTTTLGSIKMFGSTSGDATLQPTAIAGTSTVQTLPATTGTLVNRVTTSNGVSATNSDGALSFTLGAITPSTVNGNTLTTGSSTYTGTAAAVYTFPGASKTIAANDGSNLTISGQAIGDIPVASSTTAYGKLAAVATGSYLRSAGTGTLPVWSTLVLPNAATTGDILTATSTNTIGVVADVAIGSFLISQGTSTAPIYQNTRENWTSFVVSGSAATTTGQSLVDITGLVSGTLTNSTKYEVDAWLDVTTSAVTTGTEYGIGAGGSGTAAVVEALVVGTTTTNAVTPVTVAASGTATAAFLTTSSTGGVIYIHGYITTRGSGTANISIQHLKVTSGTSTVNVGSKMSIRLANGFELWYILLALIIAALLTHLEHFFNCKSKYMKKVIAILTVFMLFSFIGKELSVKATLEEWDKHFQKLEVIRQIVDQSNLPHQQVVFIAKSIDSLEMLVVPQLKDQVDAANKIQSANGTVLPDSTKKKNK